MANNINPQWAAGILLVVAVIPLSLGLYQFLERDGVHGGVPRSPTFYAWERGSIAAAVVITALGFISLEVALSQNEINILARLGASAFTFGAVLIVTAETLGLSGSQSPYPLVVAYVVLAFLGQAAIGAGLLSSSILPAWIGWTTIVWNLGFLILLPIFTPGDIYFPILHHIMPLLIGVALLWKG